MVQQIRRLISLKSKGFLNMFRTFSGIFLIGVLTAGTLALGWYCVQSRIHTKPEYRLTAAKISVNPPPVWVPKDFIETVLQRSNISGVSLLDDSLTRKLAEAFAAYPWVESVGQVVLRYPSGADVRLVYREPAALVEVPKQGKIPVDRYGILLPEEYLREVAPEIQADYTVIQGIQSMPLGSAGTPWGDPLVQTAAQLAAELKDIADEMKLTAILPATETTPSGVRIVCRLKTAAGKELQWGTFTPNDPRNGTKKQRVRDLIKQYRTLDNVPDSFQPVDLSRE
jgi:hypothetical protein